jgi:4-aminobutyrate aminotransferase-like enzyme/Ser/Thr protein kinase RdoA (MazF antagonist)
LLKRASINYQVICFPSQIMNRSSVSEAQDLARDIYGLDVVAQALDGEMDDNFHLMATSGAEFVLKVMHPERDPSFIEMQGTALAHLAKKNSGLTLPQVRPTRDGKFSATIKDAAGHSRLVWMLSYLPGKLFAHVKPHSDQLLTDLGEWLGRLDAALADFAHPAVEREMKWDLARATWIRDDLHLITDPARRGLIEHFLDYYQASILPAFPHQRRSVIHNDANDYNVLVEVRRGESPRISGMIDFGDLLLTNTICEVAIAAAYSLLDHRDPLRAAARVVAGYHRASPLTEEEISFLYWLIGMRLAVSVTVSARRRIAEPNNTYLTISEAPAWRALERLAAIHPRFAEYTFRQACGLPPSSISERVCAWLQNNTENFAPVIEQDLRHAPSTIIDLSVGSLLVGADPAMVETSMLTEIVFREMRAAGVEVGIGRYDEARALYLTPAFAPDAHHPTDERRTIHLGIDLFVAAGAPVFAPLAGEVYCVANNDARLDYGPLVILKHAIDDATEFYTLYGHLGESALSLAVGQRVAAGERFAEIGAPPVNGDWPPHLHFQLIIDTLELDRDFPGVAYASQREIWNSLSPDPNLILGIPAARFPAEEAPKAETLAMRRRLLGRNLSISYREPLKIVRGWRQYLYDETGRAYLDAYNNVPIVGHSHPRVVRAVQSQIALLNTNTRYLHETILRYAEKLTALLPEALRVCYFLNSASEANELALRLARTHTGREDVIVLEAAYHGHTTTLVDVSPYKFNGPGGRGAKPWVHVAPIPDDYRGPYKREDPEAGLKYARQVEEIIDSVRQSGRAIAAFLAETLPSVGGQIVLPPGYLDAVYRAVRSAGGVTIADEVQVGFGRLGTHFWGFETQGVVPEIVVLGKPIANGFPLAAVVTTDEIAASFDNGMEFFSTFGGNPVACGAGLATLEVLLEENLQARAHRIGERVIAGLRELMNRHAIIGDVRGSGLFLGIELVRDRGTLEPADTEASYLVNRLRECGILCGTDGPLHNVIKLRPPLVVTEADADLLIATIDQVLAEDALR